MADKPKRASEYKSEQLGLVRDTCLYVATKLGDLMDEVVVVGGLAPSLLIDQSKLAEGTSAHVGTMDLDVGLELALLDERRCRTLTERLRGANFTPDQTDEGRPTRQRWKMSGIASVSVDFLIPPSRPEDQGGKLRDIESDFAAVIAPGLMCAFQDRRRVRIDGRTICSATRRHSARFRSYARTSSTTKGLAHAGSRSFCKADQMPISRPTWLAL
jgi:hypothetical protein